LSLPQDVTVMPLVSPKVKHRRLLVNQFRIKLRVVVLVWIWLVWFFKAYVHAESCSVSRWIRSANVCHCVEGGLAAWRTLWSLPVRPLSSNSTPSISFSQLNSCACTYGDSISHPAPSQPLALSHYPDQSSLQCSNCRCLPKC